MAAVNTETIDLQNAIHAYERDNADKIRQHLDRLLADISKGKMPLDMYVAHVRADLGGGKLNNFLGHKPEDDIVVELGKSLYEKYQTEFTRKHREMLANASPFGAQPLPEVPKASKLMQPVGAGTARAEPRFTSVATPNPNAGHKDGRDDRVECKCGDVCDQWKREPRKGEPQHQTTTSKVIDQFRIMYKKLQAREQELQVASAQVKDLTAKLQESNRAAQEVDRIRHELNMAFDANAKCGEEMILLKQQNHRLTEENQRLVREKQNLEAEEKRLQEQLDAELPNTEQRLLNTAGNMFNKSLTNNRAINISLETATGSRLHVTSTGDGQVEQMESMANHHQTAYTMRTVAAAASPEAVAAFLTPEAAKYYRPLPAKASENKKPDSRVEEIVEEKKVLRIENQSVKKQQEAPISEVVARENIELEARFLKNPKEFADVRKMVSTNDPYWPENYLKLFDPEFSVGWAKRHQDRPKCAEYLAKF